MSDAFTQPRLALALVSRADIRPGAAPTYLMLAANGAPDWTADPDAATAFASMREATRAAMRLPASVKAFSMPRGNQSLH